MLDFARFLLLRPGDGFRDSVEIEFQLTGLVCALLLLLVIFLSLSLHRVKYARFLLNLAWANTKRENRIFSVLVAVVVFIGFEMKNSTHAISTNYLAVAILMMFKSLHYDGYFWISIKKTFFFVRLKIQINIYNKILCMHLTLIVWRKLYFTFMTECNLFAIFSLYFIFWLLLLLFISLQFTFVWRQQKAHSVKLTKKFHNNI